MKLPQSTTRMRWPFSKRLPVRRFGWRRTTISPGVSSFGVGPPSRSLARSTSVPGLERFQAVPSGSDVLDQHPEVGVGRVGRQEHLDLDRADDAQRLGQRLGLEDERRRSASRARGSRGRRAPCRRDRSPAWTGRRRRRSTRCRRPGARDESFPPAREVERRGLGPGERHRLRRAPDVLPHHERAHAGLAVDAVVDAADVAVHEAQDQLRVVDRRRRPELALARSGRSPRRRGSRARSRAACAGPSRPARAASRPRKLVIAPSGPYVSSCQPEKLRTAAPTFP